MFTIHGDQEPEQRSLSQLDPHIQPFSEEPDKRHARRMWFKRPTIAWIFCTKALSSLAFGIMCGPYLEVFTDVVCRRYYYERLTPSAQGTEYASNHLGRCTGNPQVQAEVAWAGAVFAIVAGVLLLFTTGWWGGFMDRYGRTRVLGMVVFAPLLGDLVILLVFFFPDKVPGGYWFLIINPIVEGILGSPSSEAAAEAAYVRDVSGPHKLSQNLTFLSGIFHVGWTVGPIIGGFLNERTGSVITAIYATSILHLAHACIVWFALPESDSEASMIHARNQFAHELASASNADVSFFRRRLMMFAKAFWNSFPLHVLTPKLLPNSERKRDWNLILLVLSASLIMLTRGSVGDMFQYTLYTFKWSSLQLGYFISATGFSTAVFLMMILPALVRALKHAPTKPQNTQDMRQDMAFDLRLLRVSSLIILAGYTLMALAPTGFIFALCYMITSFGQGFLPVVQGLATMLYVNASGEGNTGRLFSALSVVYALGARLFGPLIFGAIFSSTVSFFPTAIFWTSVGCTLTAFLLLVFVRVPNSLSAHDVEQQDSLALRDDRSADSELEPLLL